MARKVEICGIDTASLPKLSVKEAKELLLQISNHDEVARSKFIMNNMRLVLSLVQRYGYKTENMDDIFQAGCVGLVKAVDNFDIKQNVLFSTYAVPMIVGEMKRLLRESNGIRVSRGIRDTAYQIMLTRQQLEAENNQEVTDKQLADKMNIDENSVRFALDSINQPMSIYEPIFSDGVDEILIIDQVKDVRNVDEHWLNNVSLSQAILTLSDREKKIVKKRYYEGKTQTEVSQELNLSQAQISRLEKTAVEHIKNYIQ